MSGSGGCRVWTEARKQERRLRGMMVDYKKRAERRREYYDRIKTDPAQFMQVHGRSLKIHLDPSLAAQAEAPSTMVQWQNQADTIIDRFDVRAHLDVIPEQIKETKTDGNTTTPTAEESQINYERYRILVQNDFAQVKEHKFLHQIYLEERFGGSSIKKAEQEAEKKKLAEKKAAIGYNYDGEGSTDQGGFRGVLLTDEKESLEEADGEGQVDSEEEFDLDIVFDVDHIPSEQAREMNLLSTTYGMTGTEFIDQLVRDKAELEALREAKAVEEERAAGRRNRRDRRRAREQARARDLNTLRTGDAGQTMGLLGHSFTSLPAYAAAEPQQELASRASDLLRSEKSSSRSPSPDGRGKVCFITSFGGESGDEAVARRSRSASPSCRRNRTITSGKRQTISSLTARNYQGGQRLSIRRSRSSSSSSDDSVSSRERRRRRARKNGSQQQQQHHHHDYHNHQQQGRGRSSSTSSSSSSRRRSRSRSRSRRRSASPKPPVKLPTPPRKSYYRHDLKSDGSAEEDSSPDEGNSQTSDNKNQDMTVDTQLMQHMPVAVQGQILGQAMPDALPGGSDSISRDERKDKEEGEKKYVGSGVIAGVKPPGKLTPQERLRRKMQAMLKKTHQTDQLARMEKEEKAREEWMQRQEQLKEHVAKYGRTERRFGSDGSDEGFSPRRRSLSRDRGEREWGGFAHGHNNRDNGGREQRSRSRDRVRRRLSRSGSRTRQRRSRSRSRQKRSRSRERLRGSPARERRRGNGGGYHHREIGTGSSSSRWSRERSNERRIDNRYRDSRRDRSRERNFGKVWERDRSPRRRDDRRASYR
ncbi:CLK4-associating serine/arginine rich protein-like isoform X1 [Varroa destructor]|uniref:Suppressor of white apricot N-terminal domain-containing protein n=2 Tax=Varroa destructor TaxID=109461 RepID=A0A7M7KMG9_VARDE|nr:CLK4-associating serine/arginine rich protein-like isoform X1 [Varroa destructor]XP_022669100.1 CLK4-associating serine/arginine rich protein-like isoform X1 [Varroa destructor]